MTELNAAINRSIVLKGYKQWDIEHLSRCLVKIIHNDKFVKCRFFVVVGGGPALLSIPDIELMSIIRVICETIDNKTGRKFDVQAWHIAESTLQNKQGPTDIAGWR